MNETEVSAAVPDDVEHAPAPPESDAAAASGAPAYTREAIRDRVKANLASGRISERDLIVDMYTSMVWLEMQAIPALRELRAMMPKRVARRLAKEAMEDGGDQEAPAGR